MSRIEPFPSAADDRPRPLREGAHAAEPAVVLSHPNWSSEAVLQRRDAARAEVPEAARSHGAAVTAPLERDETPGLRRRLSRAVSVPLLAGAAAFVIAVAIAITLTALQARPAAEAAAEAEQLVGAGAPAGERDAKANPGAAAASGGTIYVHVIGAVARPGVVEVEAGTRLEAVLAAAGGATDAAVLTSINLAREAVDGEQILVPDAAQVAAGAAGGGGAVGSTGAADAPAAPPGDDNGATGSAAGPPVNLNSADAAALETLPRIGPALAQRIIEWRAAHGGFETVDQLLEVPGIGAKTLDGFRDRVTAP